jgi:hypothetical protein
MTWVAQQTKTDLYEKTHHTLDGIERIGSAYWWFRMAGITNMESRCMAWPSINSPARARMAEFAIANAALLGAQFVEIDEAGPGWSGKRWGIENYRMVIGWHEDQAEAACAFLSHKGWWVCFNTQTEQWELARI